ncbi:MAG: YraN family protein [Lachnospiraceae bacterium]|nr:YraN family protein [Lachnospiraceae bacterium]
MGETNRRQIGGQYEELAACFLERKGYRILERNYRCRSGEIDLIAARDRTLAFVEVKYRASGSCGTPEEAVNAAKQRRIYRVAQVYMTAHPEAWERDCRFDVAAFRADGSLQYYEGAFGGM